MDKFMPTWVDKSFALVQKGGYLDKLAYIYPSPFAKVQALTKAQFNEIKNELNKSDDHSLVKVLLNFKRFPFNDPYIGFLRQDQKAIYNNPQTVKRICSRLRQIGLNEIVKGLEQPKQFNRQMGQMFNKWLRSKYLFIKDDSKFKPYKGPLAFLHANGEKLRSFANQIGCGLQKRPDFVAKAKGRYVVGEAKFIGAEGGNQNRAFDDALALASRSFKQAVTVAILDGIVWIPDSGQMAKRLKNYSGNTLTALLLDDFLASL